jgi:hypothetical protein
MTSTAIDLASKNNKSHVAIRAVALSKNEQLLVS